jgi:hypothetical protein
VIQIVEVGRMFFFLSKRQKGGVKYMKVATDSGGTGTEHKGV